jgi:ribosomal RNA-processing protein 1
MARDWTNIDVLRMEKFLLLTRRMLGAHFGLLKEEGWEGKRVEAHLGVLEMWPLNVGDVKLPNGMRYHVIDIYVDELERMGALEEGKDGEVPLEKLLEPLRKLRLDSPTKAVRMKCKEALEDERLPGNEKAVEETEVVEGEWGGIED